MAREWTLEAARVLLLRWSSKTIERAVRDGGTSVELAGLEAWLLEQQPACLAEAERLLDLITAHEAGVDGDPAALCGIGGAVRNDLGRHQSRVDVSFAPCASGPMAGRA